MYVADSSILPYYGLFGVLTPAGQTVAFFLGHTSSSAFLSSLLEFFPLMIFIRNCCHTLCLSQCLLCFLCWTWEARAGRIFAMHLLFSYLKFVRWFKPDKIIPVGSYESMMNRGDLGDICNHAASLDYLVQLTVPHLRVVCHFYCIPATTKRTRVDVVRAIYDHVCTGTCFDVYIALRLRSTENRRPQYRRTQYRRYSGIISVVIHV